MAGVSSKEIKNRIKSMESTKQITKAMEMVASSKLRRAQAQVSASRPYFQTLLSTIEGIAGADRELSSPYLTARPVQRAAYVVIAGDRGLAGGYNSNVLKLALHEMDSQHSCVVPIGKKAADFFRSRPFSVITNQYAEAEDVTVGDCFSLAKLLCKSYLAGEIDQIHLVYTDFVSVLSQMPVARQILPLNPGTASNASVSGDILYEPDGETVLVAIIPEYIGGVIYGALCESRAAEQAARRTAMDSATSNAEDMIAELSLKYNRARQAAITQEITEIVAGS